MSEADLVPMYLDYACLKRGCQADGSVYAARILGDRDCRARVRCGSGEEVTTLGLEGQQPAVHKVVERVGNREWLSGFDGDARARQRPHDLEGEEGVSTGCL